MRLRQPIFQLLHFSDTHNNKRATRLVAGVASKFPDACVAFTGDLCTYSNKIADPQLDGFTNPRVWVVPGEHDIPADVSFAGLLRVRWDVPFLEILPEVSILGLNSASAGRLADQITSLRHADLTRRAVAAIVLVHNPPSDAHIQALVEWLAPPDSSTSLVLCHGHVHGDRAFFASSTILPSPQRDIHISHVYSANMNNGQRHAGYGNLIRIFGDGNVTIDAVGPSDRVP